MATYIGRRNIGVKGLTLLCGFHRDLYDIPYMFPSKIEAAESISGIKLTKDSVV